MIKLCFVFTVNSGAGYGRMPLPVNFEEYSDMKEYFSHYYNVSFNYLRDKDQVDYLVLPNPFSLLTMNTTFQSSKSLQNYLWLKILKE